MARDLSGWTLPDLAQRLGATLEGAADGRVTAASAAGDRDPASLTFAESPDFLTKALAGEFAAILLPTGLDAPGRTVLRHPRPRLAFGLFLSLLDAPLPLAEGADPRAAVSPEAQVAPTARIGAFAVVEAGARVGENARVYPFAYVGEGCVVGEGSQVLPHAVLVRDVTLGAGVTVHPGAVLGADGFGYAWDGKRHAKIPQVGRVDVGDDVEIGALAAVDRATAGATRVEGGARVDNLVQIAHNCRVGPHAVLAAQVGLAGSTTVGGGAVLGGQVGTNTRVTIAPGARIGGQTGVTSDVDAPGDYWGTPVRPLREVVRTERNARNVPQLVKRIEELERRLAALEAGS